MEKPIPKIATRALAQLEAVFLRQRQQVIQEMADVAGVDLSEGWTLGKNGTVFVRPGPNGQKPTEGRLKNVELDPR